MHIAVAGNIGSGKTTLTKMLAKRYGWEPRFEPVDNNPYLDDFYADMERWSFNLQIYFLNKRFKEVVEISKYDGYIIQDRTIFEDARIFATNDSSRSDGVPPPIKMVRTLYSSAIGSYSLISLHSASTYLSMVP